MKKITAVLLACIFAVTLAGCGAKAFAEGLRTYSVAVVSGTDSAGYFAAVAEGCRAYCESSKTAFSVFQTSGDSAEERRTMVEQAAAKGNDIIVLSRSEFAEAIIEFAPKYTDIMFIALDIPKDSYLSAALGEEYDNSEGIWNLTDYVELDNVYNMTFREELAGYMAGYAAVRMGYTNLGFLGAMETPEIIRYGYGFVQGADAAAKEAGSSPEILYAYANRLKGDDDLTKAVDIWYATGTQAVFACGGTVFRSVAEAAQRNGGRVIGSDTDQKQRIDSEYGEGITATSAMKGIKAALYETLDQITKRNGWNSLAGRTDSMGLVSGTDPGLNYIQLPLESTQFNDGFTEEDYRALVSDMFDGTVTVSADTSAKAADFAGTVVLTDLGEIG